jgi:hypothetical protein
MSHLCWLDEEHLKRIGHMFPKPRGVKRADDRRVLSSDPEWPTTAGCAVRVRSQDFVQPVCRWSRIGVFARIFKDLARLGPDGASIIIDSTHLKAHRTAASLSKGGLISGPSAVPRAA